MPGRRRNLSIYQRPSQVGRGDEGGGVSTRERADRILRKILPRLVPNPVHAYYAEPSLVFSSEDDRAQPSETLISLALEAVRVSKGVALNDLDARWSKTGPPNKRHPYLRPSCWPGEHYRLLAGLTVAVQPQLVVEIGTGGGLSALAMKKVLPIGSRIATFDVVGWQAGRSFNVLTRSDFEDGSLVQYLADLSKREGFYEHLPILRRASMIFVDGPKDGIFEQRLLDNMRSVSFDTKPMILILDDIRLWNMLGIWRKVSFPKLDLTSFGHWSGTGLIEWG